MPATRKRSVEPIAPTNIPGEPLDPKLDEDGTAGEMPSPDDEHVESDEEQQARDSEQAFDRALTRTPPG